MSTDAEAVGIYGIRAIGRGAVTAGVTDGVLAARCAHGISVFADCARCDLDDPVEARRRRIGWTRMAEMDRLDGLPL